MSMSKFNDAPGTGFPATLTLLYICSLVPLEYFQKISIAPDFVHAIIMSYYDTFSLSAQLS